LDIKNTDYTKCKKNNLDKEKILIFYMKRIFWDKLTRAKNETYIINITKVASKHASYYYGPTLLKL